MPSKKTLPENLPPTNLTDAAFLNQVILQNFNHSVLENGEMIMPCVPAMHEYYMKRIGAMFDALGNRFNPEQLHQLGQILARKLEDGFRLSAHAKLLLKYEPAQRPKEGLTFNLSVVVSSVAEEYQHWVDTRQPPLFGSHPDAKVMAVAAQLGEPATAPACEVGAGIGRNSLALAKLGYPVDAIELSPAFVQQLQTSVKGEKVTVTQGEILDPLVRMQPAHYRLALGTEVVASHIRDIDQLRLFLVKMSDLLCSDGLLLFSIFLAVEGYEPDKITKEMSQVKWSCIFTRRELAAAMEGLPIEPISDESVYEYELQHRPAQAWPPSDRFSDWVAGKELFTLSGNKPAVELRWILCRRL